MPKQFPLKKPKVGEEIEKQKLNLTSFWKRFTLGIKRMELTPSNICSPGAKATLIRYTEEVDQPKLTNRIGNSK